MLCTLCQSQDTNWSYQTWHNLIVCPQPTVPTHLFCSSAYMCFQNLTVNKLEKQQQQKKDNFHNFFALEEQLVRKALKETQHRFSAFHPREHLKSRQQLGKAWELVHPYNRHTTQLKWGHRQRERDAQRLSGWDMYEDRWRETDSKADNNAHTKTEEINDCRSQSGTEITRRRRYWANRSSSWGHFYQ